jgi:4-diphosphocytidyl-2-C-methyl-D-erythritol kinase
MIAGYDCLLPWMGFLSPPALLTMLLERFAGDVVAWAPAKVNLYLEVLGKRPDGYHALETLMVAVSLCDTLVFQDDSSGQMQLQCNWEEVPKGPENLVLRAAELLRTTTGCRHGAKIRLVKRIPLAAGLAGGSTDAAATLAGLNRLWDLQLPDERLAELGAKVGSDVAFFFQTPAAWCTGRGEIVTPAPLGKKLWLTLACPPFGLATAEVYGKLEVPPVPTSGDGIRKALAAGDVEEVGRLLHNRLQEAAMKVRPEVADYQRRLEELRPAGARMSGSGSTLFALGRNRQDAVRIAHELRHGSDKRLAPSVFLVRSWS